MPQNRILPALAAGTVLWALTLPAHAAGGVALTLNGKPVTSVPVDQLGAVTVTVNSGNGAFKKVYAGQWSGIDQALNVVGTWYKRDKGAPDLDRSHTWNGYTIARTGEDSTWGGKASLSASMNKVARDVQLYRADTDDNVTFTIRFRRKVYTGKTVWKDGGWVKETRWETVGPAIGQTTLKLDPPNVAKTLKSEQIAAAATSARKPEQLARWLLYPTSYGGRTVAFEGSKILGAEPQAGKTPTYAWNFDGNTQLVYAKIPANLKIHAAMQTTFEGMPVPTTTEADFLCPIQVSAICNLSTGAWKVDDLDIPSDFAETARTADGKTAAEIAKGVNPMGGMQVPADGSAEDKAKAILKGLGF